MSDKITLVASHKQPGEHGYQEWFCEPELMFRDDQPYSVCIRAPWEYAIETIVGMPDGKLLAVDLTGRNVGVVGPVTVEVDRLKVVTWKLLARHGIEGDRRLLSALKVEGSAPAVPLARPNIVLETGRSSYDGPPSAPPRPGPTQLERVLEICARTGLGLKDQDQARAAVDELNLTLVEMDGGDEGGGLDASMDRQTFDAVAGVADALATLLDRANVLLIRFGELQAEGKL